MVITWYDGDCREILKTIPDKSIDFVVTSPPYNIGKDYEVYKDNISHEEYLEFMNTVIKELYRIVVDDGRIAFNVPHVTKDIRELRGNKSFPIVDFLNLFFKNEFNIREIITWFKSSDENHFSGGSTAWGSWCSASNPHLRGQVETIIVANKGSWKKESGSKISDITTEEFKIWTKSAWFIHAETNRDHPAPFPIDIPLRLIKLYTFVGDIVLDPFVGSGTTLRACEISNRNGIGIDINPEYKNNMRHKRFVFDEINKNTYKVRRRKSLFN